MKDTQLKIKELYEKNGWDTGLESTRIERYRGFSSKEVSAP